MTEMKSSWSFVGISPDARRAAEEAAAAADMDMDLWLAQLIKYTSSMELRRTGVSPTLDQQLINQAILKETAPGGRAAVGDAGAEEEESLFADDQLAPPVPEAAPAAHPREVGEPLLLRQDGIPLNITARALRPSGLRTLGTVTEAQIDNAVADWRRDGRMAPIVVRPAKDGSGDYEIIAGLDRWHAARRAHIREVPVEVRDISDEEAIELALTRLLKKPNLTPSDEAAIYLRLITEAGRSTEEVSRIADRTPAHVATMVRLLSLPKSVRRLLDEDKIGLLHARALLGANDPEAVAADVVRRDLDIYETEDLVRRSNRDTSYLKGKPEGWPAGEEADASRILGERNRDARPRIVARLAAADQDNQRDNQSRNRRADSVALQRGPRHPGMEAVAEAVERASRDGAPPPVDAEEADEPAAADALCAPEVPEAAEDPLDPALPDVPASETAPEGVPEATSAVPADEAGPMTAGEGLADRADRAEQADPAEPAVAAAAPAEETPEAPPGAHFAESTLSGAVGAEAAPADLTPEELETRLRKLLGLTAVISDNGGAGVLSLHYRDRAQIAWLLARLEHGGDDPDTDQS